MLVPPCTCSEHSPKPYIPLTKLKLQLWQRERFQKPYEKLVLSRNTFQLRLGRDIDQNDIKVLVDFMKKHPQKELQLKFFNFEQISLNKLFENLGYLNKISLPGANLSASALEKLLKHVPKCIKCLELAKSEFSDAHAQLVREFLIRNLSIEHLDVSSCLNPNTLAVISDGAFRSKSLIGLDLSNLCPVNAFTKVDGSKISALIAILIGKRQLQELYVRNCWLENLEPILEYLKLENPLHVLDISANHLSKARFV